MKKLLYMVVAVMAFVSCQSGDNKVAATAVADNETIVTTTYTGTLPAADCPGIIYELTLNAESLQDVFSLNMTYLEGGEDGSDVSNNVRGRMLYINRNGKKAIRLQPVDGDAAMYFLQVNDSTLRLVNENLEEATSGLNYDIIKKK